MNITDTKRIIAIVMVAVVSGLILYRKEIDMNVQRFVVTAVMIVVVGVVLSGCATEQGPVAGIIAEPTELSVGRPIPNFPIATADGEQTSFNELREPIAIVAFVSSSGPQCCRLNPKLVSLAGNLRNRNITVAQISEPTERCPHGPGCIATCNLKDPHLVSLCDAEGIAWNAYRRPKPNTVILIDRRGYVAAVSSLTNLEAVLGKARRLAEEVDAFEASAYAS
jgi:hypothetical protein